MSFQKNKKNLFLPLLLLSIPNSICVCIDIYLWIDTYDHHMLDRPSLLPQYNSTRRRNLSNNWAIVAAASCFSHAASRSLERKREKTGTVHLNNIKTNNSSNHLHSVVIRSLHQSQLDVIVRCTRMEEFPLQKCNFIWEGKWCRVKSEWINNNWRDESK